MQDEESQLVAVRREKLKALREKGIEPYGERFDRTGHLGEIRDQFEDGRKVRIAGRITAHRDMGKSHFLDLRDYHGRMQIFINSKQLGQEKFEIFKLLDLADHIGVEGECFTTKTGEPTVRVDDFVVLSKALRPPPEKWHGLTDVETRYRQRYLDLLSNPEAKEVFAQRVDLIRETRAFLESRGFIEVETPMMQTIAGGAAARPFKTHHNALGVDLYLRIAPELYLKRLLVGGFDKIFELNRNFRNEGISRKHNPEFTMLEVYWAYADFERMAELVEELICHLALSLHGTLKIEHRDGEENVVREINLQRPWRRARYHDLVREVDPEWFNYTSAERRRKCAELGVEINPKMADFEVTQHVFEKLVEEKTIDPMFVTHCPKELVPLARQSGDDPGLVEVYELVMNGQEISPGYSELNDPVAQRERLEHQAGEDVQKIDEDFLTALEHGMPPAGGLGLGIDRLVMALIGAENVRDVILFPHMKPPQS